MKILLIEDQSETLRVLSLMLITRGYHVQTARSLKEVRALVGKGEQYDLFICETGLPGGEGWELPQIAEQCGAKAISLSTDGTTDEFNRSHAAGFVRHLVKPIDFNHLYREIRAIRHPQISTPTHFKGIEFTQPANFGYFPPA